MHLLLKLLAGNDVDLIGRDAGVLPSHICQETTSGGRLCWQLPVMTVLDKGNCERQKKKETKIKSTENNCRLIGGRRIGC